MQIYRALIKITEKIEFESSQDERGTRMYGVPEVEVITTKCSGDAKPEYWEKEVSSFSQYHQCKDFLTSLRSVPTLKEVNLNGEIGFKVDLFDIIEWKGGIRFEVPLSIQKSIVSQYGKQLMNKELILVWSGINSFANEEFPEIYQREERFRVFNFILGMNEPSRRWDGLPYLELKHRHI